MLRMIWGTSFCLTCFSFTGLLQTFDGLALSAAERGTDAYCRTIASVELTRAFALRCGAEWIFAAERQVVEAIAALFAIGPGAASVVSIAHAVDALAIAACVVGLAVALASALATRLTRTLRTILLVGRALLFGPAIPVAGGSAVR